VADACTDFTNGQPRDHDERNDEHGDYDRVGKHIAAELLQGVTHDRADAAAQNSQKEKALKRFLEYCYMIDVKVAFEGLKGEKTKGLKATLKFAKEHDMCMTEAQIQGANNM